MNKPQNYLRDKPVSQNNFYSVPVSFSKPKSIYPLEITVNNNKKAEDCVSLLGCSFCRPMCFLSKSY